MSNGHMHMGGPHMTQNQGNVLGDRPCVRQSRLYRHHDSGNTMKDLMGQGSLMWDTTRTQGAYEGGRAYDHNAPQGNGGLASAHQMPQKRASAVAPAPQQPLEPRAVNYGSESMSLGLPSSNDVVQAKAHRRGAGHANRQTYNFLTGE